MKEFLYIILAWLFGLFGAPIVLKIEKYYKRKDIKKVISSELDNLAVRLAATCYKIQLHLGIRDKLILQWIKTVYEKYRADCPEGVLEAIEKLLQAPDEQLKITADMFKASENMALGLKKYSLNFTESILGDLSLFNSQFQRDILEIYAQVCLFNEEVEIAMFYYRLTFDPPSMSTNKDIIRDNLKSAYKNIGRKCKYIVDKIDRISER